MNNVEPRRVKGVLVDMKKFREWKAKRQYVSLVFDRRKRICGNCKKPLAESDKVYRACGKLVIDSFRTDAE